MNSSCACFKSLANIYSEGTRNSFFINRLLNTVGVNAPYKFSPVIFAAFGTSLNGILELT